MATVRKRESHTLGSRETKRHLLTREDIQFIVKKIIPIDKFNDPVAFRMARLMEDYLLNYTIKKEKQLGRPLNFLELERFFGAVKNMNSEEYKQEFSKAVETLRAAKEKYLSKKRDDLENYVDNKFEKEAWGHLLFTGKCPSKMELDFILSRMRMGAFASTWERLNK